MNPDEEIFNAVAALPEGERSASLDEACAGQSGMRERIEALLRSHEACGFMEDRTESTEASPAEQVGERIGRYRLLQQIGEGGFGTVWMAEQFEPVTRRVALKIIKAGMDTKEVIARFEAERQALAMMDHPNIARVFDAGATDKGRPFFVMELVKGIPITRFCDEQQFTTRQRLELLAEVCSAINHAHQKGIIHRDIKPSNVMVTLHGDKPVPKVIDFGIAKATQGKLTDHTLFTRFEQFVGTPAYMSPEQTTLRGLDIDTRSDIYALGILLYELLTGKPPFDANSLLSASYEDMSRIIREVEPARPSARLRSVKGEERTALAKSRLIAPDKLYRLVEPDLDWIVMKAIEKDRTRRYEAASGLAQDIRRYLADEPVSASPPSAAYRFRNFARRHRLALAAAGSTAAALIIGLTVALNSLLNERKARADEAEQRRIAGERDQQALASAREATLSDLKARRFLYAADMNLVQQALRSDRIDRARLLLDRHRPEIGTPDLRGWEWRYLWQECRSGAQRLLMHRDGAPVSTVSFSPDGTLLLAGYFDGRVELWDIPEGRIRQLVQSSSNQRAGAAFSPQAGSFASTMIPGTVRIIDLRTGTGVDIRTAGGSIRDLSYSRDGERLAVLTDNPNAVLIVRADDGGDVMNHALPGSAGVPCHAVRLSPDKQRLYIVSGVQGASTVRCASIPEAHLLWETPLGISEEQEPAHHHADSATSSIDLAPDGRTLAAATGGGGRQIQVLDAANGELIKTVTGHTGPVLNVVFSGDGRTLASTSADQTIRLWETTAWTGHPAALRGHDDEVTVATFSSDGGTLASGNRNGELLLWDARLPRPANGAQDLRSRFQSVAALPGSRMLLGRMPDGTASLIDLTTLAETPLSEHELAAAGVLGSIAFGTRQDPPDYLDETRLGLDGRLSTAALSPDGQTLAVASEHGQVGLYKAGNLAKIEIVRSHRGGVFGVAFSPDNQRLALMSGGARGIVLWDVTTRQDLITLPSRAPAFCGVEFTDDGNTLIASPQQAGLQRQGDCQFWRAPSWAEIEVAESVGGRWPLTSAVAAPPPPPAPSALKDLLAQAEREGLARRERLARENQNLLSPAAVIPRLEEAAAAIARSSPPMNSRDALVLLQLAAVQVWLGREKDHFATCQLAFRLAAGTETAAVVSQAAKAYCLIPSSDAGQMETALRLARQAVSLASNHSNLPWYQLTLGMAEFRRQNYDAADAALAAAESAAAELEELQRLYVAAGFFRAMNLHRQSREQEAREHFTAVAAKMKPLPTGGDPLLVGDYDEDLLCWLASEEARALIFPELPPLK